MWGTASWLAKPHKKMYTLRVKMEKELLEAKKELKTVTLMT